MKPFTLFLIKLFALTLILYGISFLVFTRFADLPKMPIELMLIVLFTVTAISHFIVTRAGDKGAQVFTRSYMSLSTGRLIAYSIFLFAYCFGHRDIAKMFVLTFFVYYIFYTVFEVREVQSHLKKK